MWLVVIAIITFFWGSHRWALQFHDVSPPSPPLLLPLILTPSPLFCYVYLHMYINNLLSPCSVASTWVCVVRSDHVWWDGLPALIPGGLFPLLSNHYQALALHLGARPWVIFSTQTGLSPGIVSVQVLCKWPCCWDSVSAAPCHV